MLLGREYVAPELTLREEDDTELVLGLDEVLPVLLDVVFRLRATVEDVERPETLVFPSLRLAMDERLDDCGLTTRTEPSDETLLEEEVRAATEVA